MVVKLLKASNCKVCNSPNRLHYEELYFRSVGSMSHRDLQQEALKLGESIHYRTFGRHLATHYDPVLLEEYLNEKKINLKVNEENSEKAETINILKSFEQNLNDLKTLIDKLKGLDKLTSADITNIVSLIRMHTELLERIERERERLSLKTTLSEAEMIKMMSQLAEKLCQECRTKLWVYLNDKLEAQ